jgi:peptide/nickel transport system substrate-binding protein
MNRAMDEQTAVPPTTSRSHRWRARVALVLALVGTAAGLSACGGSSSTNASDVASSSGSSKPTQGGTIYYGGEQEPPCLGRPEWVQEAYIDRQVLDSLVSIDNEGKIIPWLAQSWTVSPDGKTYTFKLKPNVKFTDGTPLNAQAVVDNFNYWYGKETVNYSNLGEFPFYKSSTAVNDLTFKLELTKAYSPLLATIAQAYFGISSPQSLKRSETKICEDPVGTGAFILDKWNHGQDLEFTRNPNYNSPPANALHQGPAYVDKLVWSFIADPTTRYGSITSGQSNAIYDVPTVDWESAKSQFDTLEHIEGGKPVTLNLNTKEGPFTDVKVRQAFAYATNRKQDVESAFNGAVPYAGNGALTESTPDYDAALANAYEYAPSKANTLLDEAGWTAKNKEGFRTKDGQTLTIKIVYAANSVITEEGATLLQDIQQQAKTAGFDVTLSPITLSELFSGSATKPNEFQALAQYFTHDSPGELWSGTRLFNNSFYETPELLNATAEAVATNDPATQKADWYKAQEILVDQAVLVGLYPQPVRVAVKKELHGVWLEASQGEPVFSDAYFSK